MESGPNGCFLFLLQVGRWNPHGIVGKVDRKITAKRETALQRQLQKVRQKTSKCLEQASYVVLSSRFRENRHKHMKQFVLCKIALISPDHHTRFSKSSLNGHLAICLITVGQLANFAASAVPMLVISSQQHTFHSLQL